MEFRLGINMRDKATEDETIKLLQKKLNDLTDDELEDTYWGFLIVTWSGWF